MAAPVSLVALTGGTGFLGSHIAEALLAAGHQVRAAVRPSSNQRWLAGLPLETVVTDLTDADSCLAFLKDTTSLVHCAGVVAAPDEAHYRQGNVVPTETLVKAAGQAWVSESAATFVLISSLAAHGPASLGAPATEANPCRPITAYGRSKREAEQVLQQDRGLFRRVILRPPSLYGPRDREFLPLLKAATKGWTVRLGRKMTGLSLVDGRDAASAAVALLASPNATGAYFVTDQAGGYDWDQIRDTLSDVAHRNVRRLEIPLELLRIAARFSGLFGTKASLLLNNDRLRDLDTDGWVCDGERLRADTGFEPRYCAVTGLAETLAFYVKQGWL